MKRIMMILLTVLLLLLTACDNRQQVGVCFRDCDDPVTRQYRQELEQTLTDAGYAVTVVDADNDQSKQDRLVAELIEDKTDILILVHWDDFGSGGCGAAGAGSQCAGGVCKP